MSGPRTGRILSPEELKELGYFLATCETCGKRFLTIRDWDTDYLGKPEHFYSRFDCYPLREWIRGFRT